MGTLISFRSATKEYPGKVIAVDHVDLEIGKGEFVFLVGPSGAGKSTLLKFIFREEVPSSGSVIVNGWDVGRLRRRRIPHLRRQIGVVFQDFRLLPQRTVYENVSFVLQVTGVMGRERRKRVAEALDIVGLAEKADRLPSHLSGGEKQRVAIARAIVGRPLVLLADEPTGNLDPEAAKNVVDVFRHLHSREGMTIMMVTHDPAVAAAADRVVTIDRGRIVDPAAEDQASDVDGRIPPEGVRSRGADASARGD